MRDVDCCVHIKSLFTQKFRSEAQDLICMYMHIVNEGKNAQFLVNFTLNK